MFTLFTKLTVVGRFSFVFMLFVLGTISLWLVLAELIAPTESIKKAKEFNYEKYKKWVKELK